MSEFNYFSNGLTLSMILLSRQTFSKQEDAEVASSPKAVSKEGVAAAAVLTQTMISETCGRRVCNDLFTVPYVILCN